MNQKNITLTSLKLKNMDTIKLREVKRPKVISSSIKNTQKAQHHGLFEPDTENFQISHGTAPWDEFGWSRDNWTI